MKKILSSFWETGRIAIIALLFAFFVRAFIFQPFLVRGTSMEPNFHNGDYLIIDEISYRFQKPERYEVVVFRYPKDESQRYIKRVVGLPGETVEVQDGKITISAGPSAAPQTFTLDEDRYLAGENTQGSLMVKLGDNEYFVLGDNRMFSSDSRTWGSLPRKDIIGKVFLRVFPEFVYGKEI
ncbi:MAG: signal peptidase I [Parcubacteria group bacterium]|nr:signal peptidase I [Parcubacteria group bacterium]